MKKSSPEKNVLNWVRSRCQSTDSVLDIGCGEGRYSDLPVDFYVGLDSWPVFKPTLLIDLNTSNLSDIKMNFDIILMLDFIEHLKKERALEIIQQAQEMVTREILVMTPIKWTKNEEFFLDPSSIHFENIADLHRSYWTKRDFCDLRWHKDILYEKDGKTECKVSREMHIYRWVK